MTKVFKIKADDIYHTKVIEASSPLTKRPATQFRVATLLMMEKEYCYKSERVRPIGVGGISQTPYPIHPRPNDNCKTVAYGVYTNLGESFTVKVKYGKGKPVSKSYKWDVEMLEGTGNGTFVALNHGTTVVYEIATMEDGNTCVTEIPVSMLKDEPTIPIPPECGAILKSFEVGYMETIKLPVIIEPGRNIKEVKVEYDPVVFSYDVATQTFTGLIEGVSEIKVYIEYQDGRRCDLVSYGEVKIPPCTITATSFEVGLGDTIALPITVEEGRPIAKVEVFYDETMLSYDEATQTFTGIGLGVSDVKVRVTYVDTRKCELTFTGEVVQTCKSTFEVAGGVLEGNYYKVQIGSLVTVMFSDLEKPIVSVKCEELTQFITNNAGNSITFIPTSTMASKGYTFTVDNGTYTCDYVINFNVKLFKESNCSVDLDTGGSAFAIYQFNNQPTGRYYVTYDMYGYPDMISVFFGDPFDPNNKAKHVYFATNADKSPVYFDYVEGQGDVYVQINCEGVTSGTAFQLYMYCPGTAPDSVVSTATPPTPGENVNFDATLRDMIFNFGG